MASLRRDVLLMTQAISLFYTEKTYLSVSFIHRTCEEEFSGFHQLVERFMDKIFPVPAYLRGAKEKTTSFNNRIVWP